MKDRREFIEAIADDESTTHEEWLDVVHICQVYGYHDCAMDILMSVTELFADRHTGAGDISSRSSLSLHIDERRYRPLSPPTDPPTATPTDDGSLHDTHRPPVKPASLPSLQLSDNGRRNNKKRNKRWANSRTTTASDADAEFSDATTTDFTQ